MTRADEDRGRDVAASVRRCAASPSSAGESVSRARRASTVDTTTFASTENAITAMPIPSDFHVRRYLERERRVRRHSRA
jgi:hypothetical protein